MKGLEFYTPVLHRGYPSIAYPCWDHCGRTSIRNLMNDKAHIVMKLKRKFKNSYQLQRKYNYTCKHHCGLLNHFKIKSLANPLEVFGQE